MDRQLSLDGVVSDRETVGFDPTRDAGLARLTQFASRTGRVYAHQRNYDFGPDRRSNVSALSPWIRHRLLSEEEILRAVLARQSPAAAEKFVQEVFWRGYFRGWLEQRRSVWTTYQSGLVRALEDADGNPDLAERLAQATQGRVGIDCFDTWARELVETGYLHNHARMWFASIWIFTLQLPWELGADFFLRHLMDGDAASNTLSWRWVAGLHTKGKTYLARADNIAKCTEGRFAPARGLVSAAAPLEEQIEHPRLPIRASGHMPDSDFILLITEDDSTPEEWLPRSPAGVFTVDFTDGRSPLPIGDRAMTFTAGALRDAAMRNGAEWVEPLDDSGLVETISQFAQQSGVRDVVMSEAFAGPAAQVVERLTPQLASEGLVLHRKRRPYDDMVWPHADRGFFSLKRRIPQFLQDLGLA